MASSGESDVNINAENAEAVENIKSSEIIKREVSKEPVESPKVKSSEILSENDADQIPKNNPQELQPIEYEEGSKTLPTFQVKCKDQMEKVILPFEETISNQFGIPLSSQILHGCGQQDEATLRQAGLEELTELLTVRSREKPSPKSESSSSSSSLSDISLEFESDSEFGASNCEFLREASIHLPQNVITDGSFSFADDYKMRFGDPTPDFYTGDLKSAFQKVCQQPEEENKLLAIYLHHDGSILTNIFCFHVMKTEKVLSTLKNHFIVYGVDITKEDKANFFFDEVRTTISTEVSNTVKGIVLDKLPAFMLLSRDFGDRRVGISVIHGDVSGEELDQKLLEQHKMLTELA